MTSPPLARWLLKLVDPAIREFLAGDIDEGCDRIHRQRGAAAARRWAARQAAFAVLLNPWRPRRTLSDTVKGDGLMRTLLQDLQYGARMVRRQPGVSFIIVLTLALAIGANTVIFSFANILVLKPLPLRDQETLAWIFMMDPQRGGSRGNLSTPDLLDYRQSLRSFQGIAATSAGSYTMTGRGDAVPLTASRVTANLMDVWGLSTVAGRAFLPGEDAPGAAKVVVLSHQFWQRQFGGDRAVLGQALTLNGHPHIVVGVLVPDIEIGNLSLIDVWTPVTLDPASPRDERKLKAAGRLAPGVVFEQAAAEVREVSRRLERDHPTTNTGWVARLARTREAMTGTHTWLVLSLLVLVVVFVLLIACANIANLVLARAAGRRRELAVRSALGASRIRVVRQLLTESTLLGVLGGALGLAIGYAGLALTRAIAYEPIFKLVVLDRNALIFTALLSVASPLVFSLIPAFHASRTDANETLKESTLRAGGGGRGRRSRSVLVVSQLALAMMLLIVAGLLIRTMIAMSRTPLGFEPAGVLVAKIELPDWRYTGDAPVIAYVDRLLGRVAALQGVRNVAATDRLPVLGSEATQFASIDQYAAPRPEDRPWAVPAIVTDRFFATTGIPIVAGRGFTAQDLAASEPVAVVNSEMARRYWGDPARAVGARVTLERDGGRAARVIGVSGNVKRADLRGSNPQIYLPFRQRPIRAMSLMIRATDAEALASAVRGEIRQLDADVAVHELRTLNDAFADEMSTPRVLFGLFVSFAVLALLLSASGLYGVISYSVSQRAQEIGIRMALGAVPGDIRRLIARQTIGLVAIGTAAGLAGGAAIARTTSSLLYDVSPGDPSTYVAVSATLVIVAAFAAYVPVRRAVRVDPLLALRSE
jgi:putative ABC transport system permease protein